MDKTVLDEAWMNNRASEEGPLLLPMELEVLPKSEPVRASLPARRFSLVWGRYAVH